MPDLIKQHGAINYGKKHSIPIFGEDARTGKRSSTALGYGYKWQQYRKRFLKRNPLCRDCERDGHVTLATVVDHIIPHRGDPRLFWDENNHQGLCNPHHGRKTAGETLNGKNSPAS